MTDRNLLQHRPPRLRLKTPSPRPAGNERRHRDSVTGAGRQTAITCASCFVAKRALSANLISLRERETCNNTCPAQQTHHRLHRIARTDEAPASACSSFRFLLLGVLLCESPPSLAAAGAAAAVGAGRLSEASSGLGAVDQLAAACALLASPNCGSCCEAAADSEPSGVGASSTSAVLRGVEISSKERPDAPFFPRQARQTVSGTALCVSQQIGAKQSRHA